MWIAILIVAALPITIWLAVRLFFHEQWTLIKIQWHMMKGRYERALPLLRQQLDRLRRKKGEDHLDTAVAKYSLGQIQYEHGRTDEGRQLVHQATAIFAAYAGPRDDPYWVGLLNLGIAQRAIERRDLAIETFRQAVDLQRKSEGQEQEQLAQALNNLGATLEESGEAQEAISIYEDALRIREAKHGANSPEAARVRVNLGEAYITLKRWSAAESNIRQALTALETVPGYELGQAYDTYARLFEEQERLSEAEQMRTNALTALERALGNTSVEVAKQMERYATLLGRLNRSTESNLFNQKAAAIREGLV
jgi:eukaryotic-like serine/threonine-protein kinase